MLIHAYWTLGAVLMVLGCTGKNFSQATCKNQKCGSTGLRDLEGAGMLQQEKVRSKINGSSEKEQKMIFAKKTAAVTEDEKKSTNSGKFIDYKNCVISGTRGRCQTCTHNIQCGNDGGEPRKCAPNMKRCVNVNKEEGCDLPSAMCTFCKGPNPWTANPLDCKCKNKDFPAVWLGKACGLAGQPYTGRILWSSHPSKCMDVSGGNTNNGANLQLWDWNPGEVHANHLFTVSPGDGLIQWGNKCLDVEAGRTANGNNIILWDCDNANGNQIWTVTEGGAGPIKWWTHPNKCIDVKQGGTHNGVNVEIWDCVENNPNQIFMVPWGAVNNPNR